MYDHPNGSRYCRTIEHTVSTAEKSWFGELLKMNYNMGIAVYSGIQIRYVLQETYSSPLLAR